VRYAVVEAPEQPRDRQIQELNGARPGLAVTHAVPGIRTALPLAATILEAIGQPIPDAGFHLHDLELMPTWLAAHGVSDLVIIHADLYPAEPILEVGRRLDGVCKRMWLIVDSGRYQPVREALGEGARVVPWQVFAAIWLRAKPTERDPGPTLELDHAWREEHERLTTASRLGLGTAPYLIGFWEAATWTNGKSPSRTLASERLRALLARFADPSCRVQAARGADVGIRPFGWEIRIDHQRVAGGPATLFGPRREVIRLADVAQERDPFKAAAAALSALELRSEEILAIRVGDVAQDGATVRLRRDSLDVPPTGRPFIVAQRLARTAAGAADIDFLFHRVPPPTPARLTSMILATQRAVGDSFFLDTMRDRPGEDERWLQDRGFWLHYRPRGERESLRPEGMDVDRFKEMLLEALAAKSAPVASRCSCSAVHPAPTGEMPAFPPARARPTLSPNHPWRTPAFRGGPRRWTEAERQDHLAHRATQGPNADRG
jgi:hypothetical protein